MSHCFISYHQDDKAFAQAIQQEIEKAGIPTWRDPEKTASRKCWHLPIEQALRESFAVLLLFSSASRACECVTYEWAFALGAGIRVIPLRVEKSEMHPRLELLPHLDFTQSSHSPWQDLLKTLHEASGYQFSQPAAEEEAPPASTQEPQKESPAKRRKPRAPETGSLEASLQADHAAVRETLTESLNHSMRDVRIQASLMLAQFQETRAIPVLIDALHDRDRDVHQHAAWGLMHIGKAAVPELLQALQDEDMYVRKDVARILGHIGDLSTIPQLIETLRDEASDVRKSAAEALGYLGDNRAVPALCHLLQDPQEHVRRTATESLGQIGDPSAVQELIATLEDESESVRVVAVWSLGQLRDEAAFTPLVELLRHQEQQLRQAAAEVLKEIADASIEPALKELLQDEHNEIRRTAARVLAHIRGKHRLPHHE